MTPRTTLFLSTHGQSPSFHAFTVANDDLPDRPATGAAVLRVIEGESRAAGAQTR